MQKVLFVLCLSMVLPRVALGTCEFSDVIEAVLQTANDNLYLSLRGCSNEFYGGHHGAFLVRMDAIGGPFSCGYYAVRTGSSEEEQPPSLPNLSSPGCSAVKAACVQLVQKMSLKEIQKQGYKVESRTATDGTVFTKILFHKSLVFEDSYPSKDYKTESRYTYYSLGGELALLHINGKPNEYDPDDRVFVVGKKKEQELRKVFGDILKDSKKCSTEVVRDLEKFTTECARTLNRDGMAAYKAKNYKDAEDKFTAARCLDDKYWQAHFNSACTMALQGQADRAVGELRRALQINRGKALAKMKKDHDLDSLRNRADFLELMTPPPLPQADSQKPVKRSMESERLAVRNLIEAVKIDDLKSVKLMLDSKVSPNEMYFDWSGFQEAVYSRNLRLVALLLQYGANIDMQIVGDLYKDSKPIKGFTPLMIAVQTESPSVVKYLLDHCADTGLRSAGGLTALELAKRQKADKLVELLMAPRPTACENGTK